MSMAKQVGAAFRNLLFSEPKGKYPLEEDSFPKDKSGKPDLSLYKKPLADYIAMYEASMAEIPKRELSPDRANLAWRQRVYAVWGFTAKGTEAIPYLLTLVRHKNPGAREDSAFLLGELKRSEGIADVLTDQLEKETDLVAKTSFILALGSLRYKQAIPTLARLIFDNRTDPDHRIDAVDSLDKIAKTSFSKSSDPVGAATEWLKASGHAKREDMTHP